MVGKMWWIDEFSGLDGMNTGLMQQWLLTADWQYDCSTPRRQRQETLGHSVTTSSWYDERWWTRWSQTPWAPFERLVKVDRTSGGRLCWHLNARTRVLDPVASVGLSTQVYIVWSAFLAWQTKRAAVLTAWSRFKSFAGRSTNSELQ